MQKPLTSRLLTAIVAIFSMLFMQLAVAAYACPETASESQSAAAAAMAQDMPNCDGMDPEQSTLCHMFAYGEPTTKSIDKPTSPNVPPFVAIELVLNFAIFDLVPPPARQVYPPIALMRTSAPPIAIRNCCFRI